MPHTPSVLYAVVISGTKWKPSSCVPQVYTTLDVHNAGGEEYDLCPRCGGLWLDRGEFRLLTRESDVYKENFKDEYLREPLKDPVEYISCVRCGKFMNRKNFGKISGVVIDECGKHGVWLDRGEIEKIRHFIADGGLERAQDLEIEKTRTELKTWPQRWIKLRSHKRSSISGI